MRAVEAVVNFPGRLRDIQRALVAIAQAAVGVEADRGTAKLARHAPYENHGVIRVGCRFGPVLLCCLPSATLVMFWTVCQAMRSLCQCASFCIKL